MTYSLTDRGIELSGLSDETTSVREADDRSHGIWEHVQRGLVYPAPFAVFATFWAAEGGAPLTRAVLSRVAAAVRSRRPRTCRCCRRT